MNTIYGELVSSFNKNPRHEDFFYDFGERKRMQPINILFVCLGNICRSPMAEYLMREKIKQAHLQDKIFTASAGTSGWHDGESMHCGTADILDQHKIASNDFVSRKVRSILAM